MRRFLLACLFVLAALPALAATATTKYSLTNSGWTDLGAGPLLLSFTGTGGVYAIGDTTPSLKNEGFTKARGGSVAVRTASHVWGTTKDNFGVSVYVAPITGGGTTAPTSVWSAADAAAGGMTLSNGGLTVTDPNAGSYQTLRGSISKSSGKVYFEIANGATALAFPFVLWGVANAGFTPVAGSAIGDRPVSFGIQPAPGNIAGNGGGFVMNYIYQPPLPPANSVNGVAVDFSAGSMWFSVDGVWANGSNPATGSLPAISFTPATAGALFPTLSLYGPTSGTWTLKPTAASQTYAPPAGFSAWDAGGAAPGCSEATAYLARAPGETAHAADLTTLICGLVTDGVWAKLDGLYVLAQQTAADGLLNLVSASYPLTTNGTFTAYQGYSGFTGTGMTLTGYNPSGGSLKFTQSNASLGVWSYAVINDSGGEMGSSLGTSGIYDDYAGAFYPRVNASATPSVTTPGTKGLFVGDRTISASLEAYWNGVDQGTIAGTSVAPDGSFFVGCGGSPSTCTSQIVSEAHIGASLGASGNLALYNRLRTYLTSVGVP